MSKTFLVTGATDGIGQLTAKMLIEQGHRVILHGRSASKLDAAVNETGGKTEFILGDMSQLNDVSRMAEEVRAMTPRLDVLINNAGVLKIPTTDTPEGWDIRFVVNTLAPYLLTRKLLPIMPGDGRVVNLSSAAQAPFDASVMLGQTRLADDLVAYAQSKLGITIWSQELARELTDGPVVVSVNPGSLLASKMVKEGFGMPGNDLSIGASILIEASLGDSFADASGKYYDNDAQRFSDPHTAALDNAHCQMVMQTLHDLIDEKTGDQSGGH